MASKGKTLDFLASQFLNPPTQLDSGDNINPNNTFEFEESEMWSSDLSANVVPTPQYSYYSSKKRNSNSNVGVGNFATTRPSSGTCSSSLPVNVPDWSKIYKKEKELYGDDEDTDHDEEEDYSIREQGGGDGHELRVIPPHEYLARQRGASFSVHEGRGRTLKGRDLRQVRNAVWKKIGFED